MTDLSGLRAGKQPASAVGTRCYRIVHRTHYRYSDVVTGSYGRGFLTPRDLARQRCLWHELRTEPEPVDRSISIDVYGNTRTYFHVTAPHRVLTVNSESIVEVEPVAPWCYTRGAARAPWEAACPAGPDAAAAVEFALDLAPAEITDAVREYAAPSFAPARPLVDVIRDVANRIHTDFTYRPGATTVSSRVGEVVAARAGVCQDFARLAIACLRANGLAASYVSGYLATDPPPGKERMLGALKTGEATHAWAAVWTPGGTWLGFDPTNNQLVDERYVVVGWGRDYADVPPLRGIIFTESESSVIDVAVDVARIAPTR